MLSKLLADVKHNIFSEADQRPEASELVREHHTEKFLSEANRLYRLPGQIERYFRTWTLYALYATTLFVLTLPLQTVYVLLSVPINWASSRRGSSEGCYCLLTGICVWVFTRDWLILDISYLYHLFRGQTTLKFYGLMFAFEVSEKLLTMVGQPILAALQQPRVSALSNHLTVYLISLLYVLLHAFSIYLEFAVFIVVINSQPENFVIYCFVINLTKMKSTAFKKFDVRAYRGQINHDMKDRMHKLLYLLMFALSQSNREVQHYHFKLSCVFLVGMLIEWIKHATVLNTSEKNISLDDLTLALKELVQRRKSYVAKCLDIDYNLLPLATFLLKMSHTIFFTNNSSVKVEGVLTVLAAFLLCELLVPTIVVIKRVCSVAYKLAAQPTEEELLSDSEG